MLPTWCIIYPPAPLGGLRVVPLRLPELTKFGAILISQNLGTSINSYRFRDGMANPINRIRQAMASPRSTRRMDVANESRADEKRASV